jgi:phage terminase large subunit-like protein
LNTNSSSTRFIISYIKKSIVKSEIKSMSILVISSVLLIGLISSISYVTINFSILDLGTMHSALALDQNSTGSETSDGGEAASNSGNDNSNNVPTLENQNNTDIVDGKENMPISNLQPDPSKLSGILVGDKGYKQKLILHQYTTADGTFSPASADYPKKARFTLQNGDKIKLISGNPDFKIVIYSMSLTDYKNGKKQPIYVQEKTNKIVVPDISPGTYRLYVKAEYTPSDDDVVYFIDTVKIQNTGSSYQGQNGYLGSGSGTARDKTIATKSSEESRRTEINATVQISTFNETKPSDIVFKITPNNQSQFGIMSMNESNSMSLTSSQMLGQQQLLNVTFAGIPINQTQPQSPVIKVLYPFNQTIQLDGNAALQALPFNETMPNDIILQLAPASNVTTICNSLILQFIPTNQTAYKMTLLPHARPNEN